MNKRHLELCSSAEWGDMVARHVIPWVLDGLALGGDVLEVGPGPGRTTDILCGMVGRLTAVEVDEALAAALAERFAGSNVKVVQADATQLPMPAGSFSGALSFTMLHHVPTPELQDQLLAEVARVLAPGGVFAGTDSLDSADFRELHIDDICVPIDPATLAGRLTRAGFTGVQVDRNPYAFRFRGFKPGQAAAG